MYNEQKVEDLITSSKRALVILNRMVSSTVHDREALVSVTNTLTKSLNVLKPMTVEEYIDDGATMCPFCRSANTTGGHIEIEDSQASQKIGCEDCNCEWYDTYKLTGYVEIE